MLKYKMDEDYIKSYLNDNGVEQWKYWYGAKRQKATQSLLDTLKAQNPSYYTDNYVANCKIDIQNGVTVCDCSGFVCGLYQISDIGTSSFASKFNEFNYEPRNGMILWRSGHCGIYYEGTVLQMKNQVNDYYIEKYVASQWSKTYYLDSKFDYCGWQKDINNKWWLALSTLDYVKQCKFDSSGYWSD